MQRILEISSMWYQALLRPTKHKIYLLKGPKGPCKWVIPKSGVSKMAVKIWDQGVGGNSIQKCDSRVLLSFPVFCVFFSEFLADFRAQESGSEALLARPHDILRPTASLLSKWINQHTALDQLCDIPITGSRNMDQQKNLGMHWGRWTLNCLICPYIDLIWFWPLSVFA